MRKRVGTLAVAAVAFILGGIAVQFLPAVYGQDTEVKKPKWQWGMSVQVRKADEANFSKDTKRIGIEVFRDDNNGNVIYISETGSIAVLPGK